MSSLRTVGGWQLAVGSRRAKTCTANSRRGLSLIEVMISLAICSLLLTAVATAFSASANVIEKNDEFFRASQAARVAMNQILADIRQCDAVQFVSSKQISTLTMASDGVTVKKDNTYFYSYNWTTKTGSLKLVNKLVTPNPQYVLANQVSSLNFAIDSFTDKNGIVHISRVTVVLGVDQGDSRVTLSGSASLRRLQTYH